MRDGGFELPGCFPRGPIPNPHSPIPSPRAADQPVKRQQIEESHQGLRPLSKIGHRLGLERVEGPECGNGQPQRRGGSAEAVAHRRQQQGPPQDAKQQQGRRQMDGQVGGVKAPDVQAAHGIVDRQGEVQQRPAGDGRAVAGRAQGVEGGQRRRMVGFSTIADRSSNTNGPPKLLLKAAAVAATIRHAERHTAPRELHHGDRRTSGHGPRCPGSCASRFLGLVLSSCTPFHYRNPAFPAAIRRPTRGARTMVGPPGPFTAEIATCVPRRAAGMSSAYSLLPNTLRKPLLSSLSDIG